MDALPTSYKMCYHDRQVAIMQPDQNGHVHTPAPRPAPGTANSYGVGMCSVCNGESSFTNGFP